MNHAEYVPAVMMLRAKDYPQMAARLNPNMLDILHGAMGMSTEVVELMLAWRNHDGVNVIEELGDLTWFASLVIDSIGRQPRPGDYYKTWPTEQLFEFLHGVTNEILDALKAHIFYGRTLDLDMMQIKADQVFSMIAEVAKRVGLTLDDVRAKNLAKLQARYPNKFTEQDANHRDLDAERAALLG